LRDTSFLQLAKLTREGGGGEACVNPAAGCRSSVVDRSVVEFSVVDRSGVEPNAVELGVMGRRPGEPRLGEARLRVGAAPHVPSQREGVGAGPRGAGAQAGAATQDTVRGKMRGGIIAASEDAPLLFG